MSKKKKNIPIQPATTSKANAFLGKFESNTPWHIIILLLFPFFVYIKTAGFEFINFDDAAIILKNFNFLHDIHNIPTAFKTDAFINIHGDFYRPLQTVSFITDALMSQGRPLVFHLTNLTLHLLSVLSLYYLLRNLQLNKLVALSAALLFSVHPLLASAVSWVPARGDLLACLFCILAFNCFDKYFKSGKIIYFILHSLCFLAAVFSKETSVLLPLLLMFYYYFILNEKSSIKKLSFFVTLWVLIFFLFYFLRSKVVAGATSSDIIGISPFYYNLPAIPIILCKFLFPVNLSTMPLFEYGFTMAGSLLLVVIIVAIIKYSSQKKWLFLFGFIWFFLFMVPPMFFKLNYSNFLLDYYEHRAYLPFVGLIIMLSFLVNKNLFHDNYKLLNWIPLLIIFIFAFLASAHSDDFKDSMAFWDKATEFNNPGAFTKRGEEYAANRDFAKSLDDFNNAVQLSNGQYPAALFDLGKTLSQYSKDHQGAENAFTQSIMLDSNLIDAYISRADERVTLQNIGGAISDLAKAKKIDSANPEIYYIEGKANVTAQNFDTAVASFSKAIRLDSLYTEAYNDRAFAYYKLKDFSNGIKDCNKTIALNNSFFTAYYNKGMMYYEMGKADTAIKLFDTTLAITDNLYFGYFYRGMAKKQLNDMSGACSDWKKSVDLGFTLAQDTIKKYCK